MADLTNLTSDQFLALLDRAGCPDDNHEGPTLIVHSPGFFDNGGVGTSTYACARCVEDVTALIQARYGGARIRRPSRR